jgi:hypothetical protein
VNLYVTYIGNYDVIIGMYWLEFHWAVLDCRSKTLNFVDFVNDEG